MLAGKLAAAMLCRLPRAVRARAFSSSSPLLSSAGAPQPPPPVEDQPRRDRVYASPLKSLAQTFERLSYSYALEDIARGVAMASEVRYFYAAATVICALLRA